MYKLTTMVALLKRVRRKPKVAAWAMAALLFLSALPTQARAQGTNTYGDSAVVYEGIIVLAPGQTMLVALPNLCFLDGCVKVVRHSVTARESNLTYSGESGGLNEMGHEFGHLFTLKHGDLSVPGEPVSIQVLIEVELFLQESTQERAEDLSLDVLAPTIEVIDDRSGRTILLGILEPIVRINSNPEM